MNGIFPLAVRLAVRELRGGLKGFRVFLACLALGVAAIAAVGSVTQAFQAGVDTAARALLGGDIEAVLTQRDANADEHRWLASKGALSRVVETRAMARGLDSDIRTLVEIKAVDAAYPLVGTVSLEGGGAFTDALAERNGRWGAVIDANLLPRLGLKLGDMVRVGALDVEVRAVVQREPDRVGTGFVFAPRFFLAAAALPLTDLVQFGSQVNYRYRLTLAPGVAGDDIKTEAAARFPDTPWRLRDPKEGAANAQEFIDRVSLFFTFVALATLLVGGIGVGNAVRAYLEGKTAIIAILKCVGASGGLIFRAYLTQVMMIASVSVVLGLMIGAATPNVVILAFGDLLPILPDTAIYPGALAVAALYGVLVTLTFAAWPIARARDVPAAALFRDVVSPGQRWPRVPYIVATAVCVALLCGLAVVLTPYRFFAALFLVGAAILFGLLRLEAMLFVALARAAGRPRHPGLRLALANLYRPGAPTTSAVLSIGLGLTVLVAISLIDGNIRGQLAEQVAVRAPSFFILDIRRDQAEVFDDVVLSFPTATEYRRMVMVRGRIVALNGKPVDVAAVAPDVRWVLQRERNLTYMSSMPEGTVLAAGEWWPSDYAGPPAISLGADIAKGLGVGLGDTVQFDILGRKIEARIVNLRAIEWDRGGAEFAVIFAPGALEEAPQRHMATVRVAPEREEELHALLADTYPNISIIWVRDTVEAIKALLADLSVAVRAATGVTLLAGILVLAGAIAAGHRHRLYDAVILKVLGASRARVLMTYVIEYALLGFGAALLSALIGAIAAYLVVTRGMGADWLWLPGTLASTTLAAMAATVVLGLIGTFIALGQSTARVLRAD